ncbi:hypothetical protein VCCP10303_2986, partial [Vibrio cholerae CP1030(3)]
MPACSHCCSVLAKTV